jgi:hypothetical protein
MNEHREDIAYGQEKRMSELQAFWAMQGPNTFAFMSKSIWGGGYKTGGGGGKGLR